MFEFFRTHRRWMQLLLTLLIVPSFAMVGISSYESFMHHEPALAEVAGQTIQRTEFDNAHRDQIEQIRESRGAQFDPATADTPEIRRQLIDQLINRHLLTQVANDDRFSVSDGTLRDTIAAIPQVQDRETGRFSPEIYRKVLAAQGLTPPMFEANMRRDLAVGLVLNPISASASAPSSVVDAIAATLTQQRVIALRVFKAADFRDKVQVSQQDIQTWYDANKQQLDVPEQVRAQYLVLDEAAATQSVQNVQIKDEDIESYYKQNQARFGQPERRRVSHILIQVPANATEEQRQAARARAQELADQAASAPDSFADLAKKFSQDVGSAQQGGDLGWVAPPGLEQAISELSKGQVSGVVASPAGFHVLKVTDFQPSSVKPLADVRGQIVAEIRKQLASARFADMATQLTKLVYDQRDSLQPAADALGLKLRTAAGITRAGLLPAAQVGPGAAAGSPDAVLLDNLRVRQTLFSSDVLRDKNNSGVIELSPDTMLAVRVLDTTPAHVPALADVQNSIRDRLIAQHAADAARQAGEAQLKILQAEEAANAPAASAAVSTVAPTNATPSAEASTASNASATPSVPAPPAALAASASEGFSPPLTVSRQAAQGLPRPVLEAAMRLKPNSQNKPAYTGVSVGADYILIRLDRVEAGTVSSTDRAMLAAQLSAAWGQAESADVLQSLRQQYGAKMLPGADSVIKGDGATDGS